MLVVEGSCLEVLVNGEVVELDNIRFSTDFINDFEGKNEDGIDIMSEENYDWWVDYIEQYGSNQDLVNELLYDVYGNLDYDVSEKYQTYINGVEFNDIPEAMRNFYFENNQ
jgi:hypothetical protein